MIGEYIRKYRFMNLAIVRDLIKLLRHLFVINVVKLKT